MHRVWQGCSQADVAALDALLLQHVLRELVRNLARQGQVRTPASEVRPGGGGGVCGAKAYVSGSLRERTIDVKLAKELKSCRASGAEPADLAGWLIRRQNVLAGLQRA